MRRRALSNILGTSLFAVLAITAVAACTARAEGYPTRPIKIVSPHPVGVATDILGRALALKLNESLGQPVIVENRPGANGMIAAGQIAKASPDGYTLHITTGAHIANAFVAKDLPYDVIKDFAPVTQLPRPMDLRSLRTYR
jgi:tripartite-type tricarboxylate transporter receptor subunit TctC